MSQSIQFPVVSASSLQEVADACDTFRYTGCIYFNFEKMDSDLLVRTIDFLTGFVKGYDCCLMAINDIEFCLLSKENTVEDTTGDLWERIEFTQHTIS